MIYKKYYFLSFESEKLDWLEDPVRMRQLAFQILDDVSKMKYDFTLNDYGLAAALRLFIFNYEYHELIPI